MEFKSHSPATTQKFAKLLAAEVIRYKSKNKAFIAGLSGELGAGKTTFIQGFARGLGIKHRLTSPTFLIIRNYKLPNYPIANYKSFYHIDAYRIKKPKELTGLGLREILANPKNIILIEWAEKIKRILPSKMIWIEFLHGRSTSERFIITRT